VKTTKEGVGMRSLARSILGGKMGMLELCDRDYDE